VSQKQTDDMDVFNTGVAPKQDDIIFDIERRRRLQQICKARLKPKQLHCVNRYYGLDGGAPETILEISANLNLTRQRVQQILQESLAALVHSRYLDELYELYDYSN
jgi:DNA-directed RNA polymerase sigma subunit (sigma70/sigma32)